MGVSRSRHMVMGNHKLTLSLEMEFFDPRKTNGLWWALISALMWTGPLPSVGVTAGRKQAKPILWQVVETHGLFLRSYHREKVPFLHVIPSLNPGQAGGTDTHGKGSRKLSIAEPGRAYRTVNRLDRPRGH